MLLRSRFFLGLLIAAGCAHPAPAPTTAPARNAVLITIDTLRADRVGAYSGAATGSPTPVLDALAARGTRFVHAFAEAPITLPSHATILTGLDPPAHGVRNNAGFSLPADVPTLASTLAGAGFATAAVVGAFPLDHRFGLGRGFALYDDEMAPDRGSTPASERRGDIVADRAIAWLRGARPPGARFFLWVHFFDPHAPYDPPEPFASRFPGRPYDGEIAFADVQAGRVLRAVAEIGEAGRTLVVACADHGEAFGEHGEVAHSVFVYDTTLWVPLIIAPPGDRSRTIEEPVGLVDVALTMLELLGIPDRLRGDGRSLVPAMTGRASTGHPLYAESLAPELEFGWSALRSWREGALKVIDAPRPELYDWRTDPGEDHDLAAADAGRRDGLLGRLRAHLETSARRDASQPIDPQTAARLRALGYVSAGRTAAPVPKAGTDPKNHKEEARLFALVASGGLSAGDAAAALSRLAESDPGSAQIAFRLGDLLVRSGDCRRGVPHLRRSVALGYASADPHVALAQCALQAGDEAGARRELDAAMRTDPANPQPAYNLGLLAAARGRLEEADRLFQRAIAADARFAPAYAQRGVVLARRGNLAAAADSFTQALAIEPATLDAWFNLGLARERLGDRPGAARAYQEYLGRVPADRAAARREGEEALKRVTPR